MSYHDYLSNYSSKEEIVQGIKEDITNSKDFVNIFLGYTINKSDEVKSSLFNEVVDLMATKIANSD